MQKTIFPFLTIDCLIDASSSHHILSFRDAFLSYNQIIINLIDGEKTSFVIEDGLYDYKVM